MKSHGSGRAILPILVLVVAAALAGCPAVTTADFVRTSLVTVNWYVNAGAARTLYPTSYAQPSAYRVTLAAEGQSIITRETTGSSLAFDNIAQTVWTITVVGKDSEGREVVRGAKTVDLSSSSTSHNPSVPLYYISTGSGTGSFDITLDFGSLSQNAVTSVGSILTGPGNHPIASVSPRDNGNGTWTLAMADAPVGSYNVFFFVQAGSKSTPYPDTIMVFENNATNATIRFSDGQFGYTYDVTGVALRDSSGHPLDGSTTTELRAGDYFQLTPVISPSNASNPGATWSTSNASVASVDASGKVHALGAGSASVTVTTMDGGLAASTNFLVHESVSFPVVAVQANAVSVIAPGGGLVSASSGPVAFVGRYAAPNGAQLQAIAAAYAWYLDGALVSSATIPLQDQASGAAFSYSLDPSALAIGTTHAVTLMITDVTGYAYSGFAYFDVAP